MGDDQHACSIIRRSVEISAKTKLVKSLKSEIIAFEQPAASQSAYYDGASKGRTQ
jgi:hypothetical protein